MRQNSRHSGYTLVELMIASAIAVIILGGVGTSFAVAMRMMNQAMAETEFALATRELRDKLLFQLAPPNGNFCPAGLWSMNDYTPKVRNSSQINASATVAGMSLTDEHTQTIRLQLKSCEGGWRFTDDANSVADRWLQPAGLPLSRGYFDSISVTDTSTTTGTTSEQRYRIRLTYHYHPAYLPDAVTAFDITRTETIVVPILGIIQTGAFTYGETEANL